MERGERGVRSRRAPLSTRPPVHIPMPDEVSAVEPPKHFTSNSPTPPMRPSAFGPPAPVPEPAREPEHMRETVDLDALFFDEAPAEPEPLPPRRPDPISEVRPTSASPSSRRPEPVTEVISSPFALPPLQRAERNEPSPLHDEFESIFNHPPPAPIASSRPGAVDFESIFDEPAPMSLASSSPSRPAATLGETDFDAIFNEPAPREALPPPEEYRDPADAIEPLSESSDELTDEDLLEREQFGNFTRSMIQTMNRTTYYEPGHPAFAAVRDDLFEQLRGLLVKHQQVGFVLLRGSPPQVHVDGLGGGRVNLAQIMSAGIYELVGPRLAEYMDRFDLVVLAFSRRISLPEFERFVAVMTRPIVNRPAEWTISDALLEADVTSISAVTVSELRVGAHDLPWQLEVCIARLRRDLRTIPMFKSLSDAELRKIKRQIFQDVVRPLGRVDLLRLLIKHSPWIEQEIQEREGIGDLRIPESVVWAVQARQFVDLAMTLFHEMYVTKNAELEEHDLRAFELCKSRLSNEDIPGSDNLYRKLFEFEIFTFDQLPERLQDALRAEDYIRAWDQGARRPPQTETKRDIRVVGKVIRALLEHERFTDAVEVAEVLVGVAQSPSELIAQYAFDTLREVLPDREVDQIVERFETTAGDEQARLGRIITALGTFGATALGRRIIQHPFSARFGAVYKLLEGMRDYTSDVVVEALKVPSLSDNALRVFLVLGRANLTLPVVDAAYPFRSHKEGKVRLAAVLILAAADDARTIPALTEALHDPDADIAMTAMTTLVERYKEFKAPRSLALHVLATAKGDTPREYMLQAIRVATMLGPDDPGRDEVVHALQQCLRPDPTHVGFLGIGRKTLHTEEVVAAAEEALGKLGAARSSAASGQTLSSLLDRFRR